jgi:hypothetical protein
MRASSSAGRASSKIAPQIGGALEQVGRAANQIVEDESHVKGER